MDEHTRTNLRFWDEISPHHAASDSYGVDSFIQGRNTLGAIERAEVGDVAGKELVHLQCHLGLDTLSWARLGARVTGVDFSPSALRIARHLAEQTGLDAQFVEADVTEAADAVGHRFDIVFTSRGVLMWLPDLTAWARACADLLKPGGLFYLLDHHPLAMALTTTTTTTTTGQGLALTSSYFSTPEPVIVHADGSYAVRDVGLANDETREWIHPIGDVVTALIRAGVTIDSLAEWPPDQHPADDASEAGGRGTPQLPSLFSVRGHACANR